MPDRSTHPARGTGIATALTAAVLLQLVLGLGLVSASESVAIELRPLLGGRFVEGGWLGVEVHLANDGAPRSGRVAIASHDGTVYRPVELPAGSRKQVVLYVRPAGFSRQLDARFEDEAGRVVATGSAKVRVLPRASQNVLIVGDAGGAIRAQVAADGQTRGANPIALLPSELPGRNEPLKGFRALVWAADSSGLSQAQGRALERWVAAGGHLVIVGGADWQARSAAFGPLLPVSSLVANDGANADGLAALAGPSGEAPDDESLGPLTVATGELREAAVAMARLEDGRPLLAGISVGAGRVTYLAVDIGAAPLSSWDEAPMLWTRLLGGGKWERQLGGMPGEMDRSSMMGQALGQLPALAVPPAELLLAVIVGYILLIGPVNYAVLRRLDRRELAWVTAPLLVVMFSAGTFGIGSAMKGSSVILHEISIVRAAAGGAAASVETYAGIFSPTRATYDLTVQAEALLTGVGTERFDAPSATRPYDTEQGEPARLRGVQVNVFGLEAVRADSTLEYQPWLQVSWTMAEGRIEGSVLNNGPELMEEVAVIDATNGTMIGDLAPGQRKDFSLRIRTAEGRSPVEALYGSRGLDARSDEQRRLLIRRGVLDSLIGYGGWMPPVTWDAIDRGPYVVGWRRAPGPVAIEIDGESPQHFAHTVEVISGRPTLGPGPVQLEPAQLTVGIAGTEGEATQHDPGHVSLGNGSVSFRIGLPLEAAGLIPSQMTLLAGEEPAMVFFERGNLAGFFPQGYVLSVWNGETDEWITLGDLSQNTRFVVDDPAMFLDASGQILVRVTGSETAGSFGPTGIFVGAVVEGEIDR